MQKNNQSFIRALIKFLKSKVESKPTYENVTLLNIDGEVDNGFKIEFNKNQYSLQLYASVRVPKIRQN